MRRSPLDEYSRRAYMQTFSSKVKNTLLNEIKRLNQNKRMYLKNPEKDFTRDRKMSFETLVSIVLSMGGKSLDSELLSYFNYDTNTATSSPFIQQRNKVLPDAFKSLFYDFTNRFQHNKTYKGYRLIAVDGSDLHIPHNPSDTETYFQNNPTTKGFNLLHINAMYDVLNKVYVDVHIQNGRQKNEFRALNNMVDHSKLEEPVLIIADRGYESYNVFAHIIEKGWKFLIRVKDTQSRNILSTLKLPDDGEFDEQIERILTLKQTVEVKSKPDVYKFVPKTSTFDFLEPKTNLFYPIAFRTVRVLLDDGSSQCFITNLDKNHFSLDHIRELYKLRWGIETSFRTIKHTLALTHLHSKKVAFIKQEIFAKLVLYNFCAIITSQVLISQKKRMHGYVVNYAKAFAICRHFLKSNFDESPPNVEALIQKFILPIRPHRSYPRKTKCRTFVCFNYRVI